MDDKKLNLLYLNSVWVPSYHQRRTGWKNRLSLIEDHLERTDELSGRGTENHLCDSLKDGSLLHSLTVKTLCQTRWCARADASNAVYENYKQIIAALIEISSSREETKETQLVFINGTDEIQLDQTALLYEFLEPFLIALRNEKEFSKFESKVKSICGSEVYKKMTKKKKLKFPYGESKGQQVVDEIRTLYKLNSDQLLIQITLIPVSPTRLPEPKPTQKTDWKKFKILT
ncbi:hypothetical protein FQA39_LY05896 [Lamprigera yunnana]|nr:hypothetical protein FQA39_LY05896 [Lamprigera yunnana]